MAAPETIGAFLAVVLVVLVLLSGGGAGSGRPGAAGSPSPSAAGTAGPSGPTLAAATRNALLAALVVDQRLAGHVEPLEAAIGRKDDTGADIAAIMRTMNQEVTAGIEAASRIAVDPETAALGAELRAIYDEILRLNAATLQVSIQDGVAYRAAAAELVTLLGALPPLDDRITDVLAGRPSASEGASASPDGTAVASADPSAEPSASGSGTVASPGPTPILSLVENGGFDGDLLGWTLEVATGATARATHEPEGGPDGSGAARIDIVVPSGARAGIALTSAPFELGRGGRYRVSALLRSTAGREVRLRIATVDGRTTTARTFAIGPEWTAPVFEMTDLLAGETSVIAIDVGRGEGPVWVDTVTVVPIGG